MRKIAMYRRGRGCPNDGAKEKIVWQLSKKNMSGKELSDIINIPFTTFNKIINSELRRTKVASISASEWFIDKDGNRDRIYSIEKKPRRIVPSHKKSIIISMKSFHAHGEKNKQKNTEAAQRRARLIKAGMYISG